MEEKQAVFGAVMAAVTQYNGDATGEFTQWCSDFGKSDSADAEVNAEGVV